MLITINNPINNAMQRNAFGRDRNVPTACATPTLIPAVTIIPTTTTTNTNKGCYCNTTNTTLLLPLTHFALGPCPIFHTNPNLLSMKEGAPRGLAILPNAFCLQAVRLLTPKRRAVGVFSFNSRQFLVR